MQQNVTISPIQGDPFLQGFAVGSQAFENGANLRAQREARAAENSAIAAHNAGVSAEIRTRHEMFRLGMQSKGWKLVPASEVADWIPGVDLTISPE